MLTTPFLTDNPFRLLGIGSSTPYAELRRKADAAVKALKVGLPRSTGCEKTFGNEDLERCTDIVRALANDPKGRSVYRHFWPLDYDVADEIEGTVADLERLAAKSEGMPAFVGNQLRFIAAWTGFEMEPKPERLQQALDLFILLYEDSEGETVLVGLLQQEGENEVDGYNSVCEAQGTIMAHLLGAACSRAAVFLRSGDIEAGMALLDTVCKSRFEEDTIDRALIENVTPVADREMARIKPLIDTFDGTPLDAIGFDPEETSLLSRLSEAMNGHIPAAALWSMTIEERIMQIGGAFRDHAIDAANERQDFTESRRLLQKALDLPLSPIGRQAILKDLRELESAEEGHTQWEGITPIGSVPALSTINGIGFAVYGRTPFPAKPGWYFTTHYFVVVFIPIFPLGRYLVSDAPGGGWHFYGQAPLSQWNKYHMAISLLGIVMAFVFGMISGNSGSSASRYEPYPTVSPSIEYPRSGAMTEFEKAIEEGLKEPDEKQKRRQRLRKEYDALSQEMDSAEQMLSRQNTEIEAAEAAIQQTASEVKTEREVLDKTDIEALDAFNKKVRQHNAAVTALKKQIQQFNARVDRRKKCQDRMNVIEQALQAMNE